MNSNSANDRFTVLASRVLTVLENANIQIGGMDCIPGKDDFK